MKKLFTLILCIIYFSSIICVPTAETVVSISSQEWQSKIDSQLLEIMETTDEKIPVWLWMEDIDQNLVKKTVFENTGLKETNLNVATETLSDELVADLTNYNDLDKASQQAVNKDMQSYLERTKASRKLESQRVDTYLRELRAVQDDLLTQNNEKIFAQLGFSDDDIIIAETGAPMYVIQLNKEEIVKAAKNPKVQAIYYYDINAISGPEEDDSLEASLAATSLAKVHNIGLTGAGVKLGVIDSGKVRTTTQSTSSTIDSSRVVYLPTTTVGYADHSSNVAEIAGGLSGVAPAVSIYSTYGSGITNLIDAITSQSAAGVSVANYSMYINENRSSTYTASEVYVDYIVKTKNFTLVKSAGNNHSVVTSPGHAYNVITVGGYFNGGTDDTADDMMYEWSNYYLGNGCQKPDFISNQIRMGSSTGTSYAAPVVTGIIALLFELRPTLKTQPEAVKAILMASCHKKVTPSSGDSVETMTEGLTDHQGAGAIDAYTAIAIAGSNHYGIRNMDGATTQETIQFYQPSYNATGLNVSLAWSVENPDQTTVGDSLNLDLALLRNNTQIATSTNEDSSTEMVYVTPSSTQLNYTIKINNNSNTSQSIRYAYAYSIDTKKYEYTDVSEGVFYLKNKVTGKYLTLTSSKTATQSTFTGNTAQQWLLSEGHVSAVTTEKNRLSVGSLISGDYEKAITNTSSGASVLFQMNMSNYQRDGSITFYNTSDNTALGIYNNSSSNGATAAWSTYDSANQYQKWYLEPVAYQKGDVNCDGAFSSADSTLVLQYSTDSATPSDLQQFLADINGDTEVNANDALAINRLIPD